MSESPERKVWRGIKSRCLSPECSIYYRYGGRGIRMAPRWAASFDAFLADLGPRPSAKHSIERIDNDGSYEPGNCRWATRGEQMRNQRRNRWITHNGETMCATDWAERIGLQLGTLLRRIDRYHWPVHRALTAPSRAGRPPC